MDEDTKKILGVLQDTMEQVDNVEQRVHEMVDAQKSCAKTINDQLDGRIKELRLTEAEMLRAIDTTKRRSLELQAQHDANMAQMELVRVSKEAEHKEQLHQQQLELEAKEQV